MASRDLAGAPISPGDRVLVVAAPIAVARLDEVARAAFSSAIGHALVVQAITPEGWLQLELLPPKFRNFDTILLESGCVLRVCPTFGLVPRKHRWGSSHPRFATGRASALQAMQESG